MVECHVSGSKKIHHQLKETARVVILPGKAVEVPAKCSGHGQTEGPNSPSAGRRSSAQRKGNSGDWRGPRVLRPAMLHLWHTGRGLRRRQELRSCLAPVRGASNGGGIVIQWHGFAQLSEQSVPSVDNLSKHHLTVSGVHHMGPEGSHACKVGVASSPCTGKAIRMVIALAIGSGQATMGTAVSVVWPGT